MLDATKAAAGKYNYGSVGSGSPHHLFMEALKTEFGLDIQHVPYKGTPAALTDLLTGNIQVMFCDATIAIPNIQAGKVVALGTSAAKPTSLLPSVPPIANTVPGFDWQAWQGVVAPAGTPKEVVAKLSAELQRDPGETGVQGTTVQIRHGPISATDARAVRRHDRSRAAALGEGDQGCRREGRLGNQRGERAWRVPSSMSTRIASPRHGSICCKSMADRATRWPRSAEGCARSTWTARHS